MRPAEVHALAMRGDFSAVGEAIARLRAEGTEESSAWAMALEGAQWFADPHLGRLADLGDMRATNPGDGHAHACVAPARRACLSGDVQALSPWVGRLEEMATAPSAASAACFSRLFRGWELYLRGESEAARSAAASSEELAREIDATFVLEATALRGLACMEMGQAEEGLARGREAWRAARSGSLWLGQRIAALALARLRRMAGTPALALKILSSLAKDAHPAWTAAIAWEHTMAGGFSESAPAEAPPGVAGISAELLRALHPGPDAGRVGFRGFAELCGALDRVNKPWATDAAGVAALLFLEASSGEPQLRAWICGDSASCPPRLTGVARPTPMVPGVANGAPCVYVGHETRRRVLRIGVPSHVTVLANEGAQPGRVEACIAALALAGPDGLEKTDLFQRIYGFQFREAVHEPTFRSLRYRARSHLGDAADMVRDKDRYSLVVHREFAVADPRCVQPFEETVLRFLADSGAPSAKAVASRLRVPLRTVQGALRGLVEEGACRAERLGRKIVYVVEDTTFTTPTALRAR